MLPLVVEARAQEPVPPDNDVMLQVALPSETDTLPVGVPYEPLTVTETV